MQPVKDSLVLQGKKQLDQSLFIKLLNMKTRNYVIIGIASLALILSSCETDIFYIEGTGDIVTETLELEDFTGINMIGAEDVEISYGAVQEVQVTGHANIISRIKKEVTRGVWNIDLERGSYRNYDLKYFITLPGINEISNDGASKVIVNDFINEGDLAININGAGDIEVNRMENTENVYITVDGAGHVKLLGEFPSLQYLELNYNGAGEFNGFPAIAQECRIDISGSAKCEVAVEKQLDVFIDGTGAVYYKGNPSLNQNVSGLGIIQSRND